MGKVLKAPQVAEQLGISKRQVYYLVERGQLPYIQVTDQVIRFEQADVDAYKAQMRRGDGGGS